MKLQRLRARIYRDGRGHSAKTPPRLRRLAGGVSAENAALRTAVGGTLAESLRRLAESLRSLAEVGGVLRRPAEAQGRQNMPYGELLYY